MELRLTAKPRRTDYKRIKSRGKDLSKLESVLEALVCGMILPESMCDHSLGGTCRGRRECHIEQTGCSSTASMRRGLSSLPRARGAMASCSGCKELWGRCFWRLSVRFSSSLSPCSYSARMRTLMSSGFAENGAVVAMPSMPVAA